MDASCHCGDVTIRLAAAPAEVTDCNCSLCRKYGVLWAYYPTSDILASPDPALTDTYASGGKNVDFHRCKRCGCITHWEPRRKTRTTWGINARLLPVEVLASASIKKRDGASK